MVTAHLHLLPSPGQRQAILDILRSVEVLTRVKPGCLGCAIYEECGEEPTILYRELWRSREELQRHIQSALYLRVLAAMELARETPEICYQEVTESQGMELIEAVRAPERLLN